MIKSRALFPLAAALLLAACETTPLMPLAPPRPPPPPPPPPPRAGGPVAYNAADFAWSTRPGAGRVNGHLAFGRGQYACASGVVLMPETPYVRQRMQTLYGATSAAALPAAEVRARTPASPAGFNAYVRSTSCDASNRFTFQGLAPGAWYVITVARPAASARGAEEMAIMRRVVVGGSAPVNLEL